jgi:hypothetical protein
VVGKALSVIGEYLYHPAIGYLTATALDDHALELGLERIKPCDTAFDMLKLALCDLIGSATGSAGIVG